MAGPFAGYAPPGVYTKTLLDLGLSELLGEIRIPTFIGTAQEFKSVVNYDLIRGSSATRDNQKNGEDLSYQANGTNKTFTVSSFPIVTGTGSGVISTNPNNISVFINDVRVVVNQLSGATGQFTLQLAPAYGDRVVVNYYYKRTDTKVVDENVSVQADGTNKTFYTAYAPIVDGTNSGTPTTTLTDVIAKVNGLAVVISEINGSAGYVTLDSAPLLTDTVTLTYYYNMYPNTADDLPYLSPVTFQSVGIAPNTNDFIEGIDYVIVDNQIHWGTTFIGRSGVHTTGAALFDETQITVFLVDERIVKEDVSSQFTGIENFFTVQFNPIVDGVGKGTVSENPSDVLVYINSVLTPVTRIDGLTGKIYIKTIPLLTDLVEVSYYRSTIVDETYTFECKIAGASGVGTYSVIDSNNNPVLNASITSAPVSTVWFNVPATALTISVVETVTLTFANATDFTVSSSNPNGTASGLTISGIVGRTFVDDVTGLSFTIDSGTFILADTIVIDVIDSVSTPIFTDATTWQYFIPGAKVIVNNTTSVAVGDTAEIITYNKSGAEPNVGDIYYVSYTYAKTVADFAPKLFTKFKDVVVEYGELSISNPLTLAAWLAFSNGSVAVILEQVLKQTGLETAADVSYIAALEPLTHSISGYNPSVIVPLTTSLIVQQATRNHVNMMSSERYRGERVQIFGVATGTEPQDVMAIAEGFRNELTWLVYPDGAIIGLVDAYGVEREYIVDGSFMAAALAGLNVSPVFDEATPMTRKTVVGFKRLVRELTEVEKDQIASSGIIVFDVVPGAIRIRDSLTTDGSNPFSKRPEIVTIKHKVQRTMRSALDEFVGNKILPSMSTNIASRTSATLRGLVERTLIFTFDNNILVEQDSNDPSFFKVTAYYVPIFGLAYIEVTFNIRTQL